MTPEQRIARQQKQAEADIRRAILGEETFQIQALDEGDAHSIVPDKAKFTRDIAVASWMDGLNGKDNIPGTMDWQANKDALAQEYFKQDVRGISDDDFAGLVRDHITAQSAFADVAFTAAAKETPLPEAIKEARDKSGLFGIGHKFAANQGRYLADFTRQYTDTKEKLFPYREQINQLTEMGRGAEERIVAGEGSPWEDMARVMLTIPAEDREDVLHAIAAQGKQEGETQKDAFTRTVLAFDRGFERYVMTAGEGMRDIGFTALMAGAAAESAEARRFGAPAEMPESFIRPEEEQQMDFLKLQMRDLSRGSLDPLERVELLGMSISGAVENLPMMATSFIPYVGPAMMLGSFKAETEYQLRQQYPEMDSATVEGFSMLAAPFQAASEVIGDRLLFGRLPSLGRLINAPAFRSGAIVGQLAAREVVGGAVEYTEEFFQQAFPQLMVDLAEAMGADIPDVNWGDFWRDWKANQGDLIATIIPLVLLGSGVGQFSDFRNSRALARDQNLLVAAGYSAENAAKIKEFADAGKWGEAQDLMLKDWRAVNAKGVSIPEVQNKAATKILAEREAAREKVIEKLQQVQDDVGRIAAQGGYSLSKVAGGWQVTTPDSQVTVGSAEEATALLQNHYNEAERENILAVAKLADELEKQGDTQRVEIKPGEKVEITWEDNQQAVEVAARMAGLTPEQTKRMTYSMLGNNRFEYAEGLKRAVSTIFQGGNVLTMVEETVEGRFKRALDTGAITREEATKMVQLAESIINEGKTGADRQTIFDTQAADQDRALIEAVSKIVYLDVFGRRKEGGRFTPGLITRGLKAAIQMQAPTEALAFQIKKAKEGKDAEASQMHAFLSAFRTLFGSVFKAARALKQARAQGRTEELDTFINKLIGVQAEMVEQEATVQAAQGLLAEMPPLEGQPYETFSMRVLMTRKALTDAALQQESWRDWYEEHQEVLDDFFGEYAPLFQDILSITSQAASVKANVGLALKAFGLYVRGESFDARERGEEKPGFLPAVIMNLNRLRDDKQIQGQKIKAYKASNEGAVDQAVIDRHITRLLFGVDTPSAKQFAKAQRVLSEIANDIGWTPRQVQAALWAHSIYKSGKTPESYGAYLTKLESKGTIAKRIGDLAGRGASLDAASRGRGRFAPLGAGQAEVPGVISQTSNTAAETFSIKVQAANVLADSKNVPGILGDEFMGLPFLPIMADLISSGEAFGIPMQGGPAWPLLTHNPKKPNKTTAVWASSKKGVQQIYITLQKSGAIYTDKNGNKKAIVAPFAMSQDAHKSNITFQNIVFNAIEDLISNGQLTKEQESQLSKLVRTRAESTKGGTKKLLDFPEVFSAQQFDSYINSMSFTERAFVIDTMRSAQAQSIGLPSIEKLLEQTRDVSFFGLSTGSIISFLEVDVDALEKGLAKGGSLKASDFATEKHLSYDTIVPGKIIAHLRHPIPLPLVGNRMLEAMSKRPKQSRPDYLLQGSRLPQGIPAPLLDAETLNIINDSQTVGFSAAELKAVSAAVMDEWTVLDKTNAKGVVDFVRSLKRNEAAATLTQYDPSQLKKWLNIGHIEIFKLSEFDVWFGIKKGKLSADGKSVEDDGTRELVGVSSNVPTKGMLNLIMAKALEKGANKLDAFSVKSDKFPDGFLPTLYRNHGWEVVDSVSYDPLYKEKGDKTTTEKLLDLDAKRKAVWSKTGWNVSRHGLPDVVFMQHGGIKNRTNLVTDAGSLAGKPFQRFGAEAESVAQSERDAGETSADGAVAGGDAGNGRRILPRDSDKLRRFLETASANRLALFGLSSAQRDQILQAFEAGSTYSLRPSFEDRLTGVFGPLMRDPVVRRELAQRALEKAKSEAAKLGKLKKGDVTPQEQRDRTVAGLRVLNAALAAMPPVVRTRVGGFIAVAQRTTAEGMMREIERRIAKLDVELERYLANEATQEAEDLFDRYKSQRDSGGRQAGKILASGTEQIDYALGIYDLDDEQQDTTIGGLQKRIDDADNADDLADAMNKLAIAELFSHWDKQDSESRYAAVDWMRDIIETGKLGRSIIDEERKQFLAALKEDARTSVLGDVRASLAEAENKDNQTDSSAWQTFVRNVKSAGGSLLWTTAQQIELLFGADSQVYKYFTDKIVEAANLSTDIKTAADKRRVAFMQQLFDTKSSLKLAQAMARLQKARSSGVFVNVGRVVEKVKIPVEVLERLSDGTVTPEDIGLNDAQAQQALEDFAAAGPMKRQIEVEKVVNAGEQIEKFMSEGQGIMWLLWSRQDVSRKQMERDGWNEDSLKQLDAFLSDEAKAIADFIAQDLQMAGDMIDLVYRRLFNAPMPRNKNYAPIYRLKPSDTAAMDFEAGMSSGLDAGFTKARVNNSLPLREMDAFVVFLSHWEHVSHWVSHAELMRDMKSVMFDANVQNAIRTKSGKGALEGINNRLKAIESNGNRAAWDLHSVNKIWSNLTKFRAFKGLAFRLSPVAKQTSAFLNPLLADVPAHAYAIGLANAFGDPVNFASDVAAMWESPIIQRRLDGGFSAEARIAMGRAGITGSTLVAAMQKGMVPMAITDAGWTALGAAISFRYYKKLAMREEGTTEEQANAIAMKRVERMIATSAQPADLANRALIENQTNPIVKSLWMFASESRKSLAIELMAMRNLAKGKEVGMNMQRILVAHFVQAAVTQLMGSFLMSIMGDDDDKERAWSLDTWALSLALGPINGLFVLGSVIDTAARRAAGMYTFRSELLPGQVYSVTEKAVRNIDDLFQDDPDSVLDEIDKISAAVGTIMSTILGPAGGAVDVFGNVARDARKIYKSQTED